MRKYFICCAIALSFVLGSCTGKKIDFGPQKITIWHMESSEITPFIESVANEFKKKLNDKISIDLVHYREQDIQQQYLTASIAGAGPDAVLIPADKGGVFVVGKFILPLNELFDKDEYVDVAIKAGSENDNLWGIPFSTGNHLMLFYNKALMKYPPTTTRELERACDLFMPNHKDMFCIVMNIGEPYFFVPWLASFGGKMLGNDGPTLNSEFMVEALEYTDMLRKKYSPADCDYNCMDGLFKEGKVAMITNGDWAINTYKEQLGNNFGVSLLPVNSKTKLHVAPLISGKYFMLNSRLEGDKLEKVVELVKFMTNRENQLRLYDEIGRLPGNREAYVSVQRKADRTTYYMLEQLLFGTPSPMSIDMSAIWDTMRTQLSLFFGGKRDAKNSALRMQEESLRKINDMKRMY